MDKTIQLCTFQLIALDRSHNSLENSVHPLVTDIRFKAFISNHYHHSFVINSKLYIAFNLT